MSPLSSPQLRSVLIQTIVFRKIDFWKWSRYIHGVTQLRNSVTDPEVVQKGVLYVQYRQDQLIR